MAEQGNSREPVRTRLSDSDRVEAFSNGVLAIAITLLVFNLQTPDFESGELLNGLLRQWPTYIAYLASFLYLAVIWLNHDALFSRIRYVDLGTRSANIGVLLTSATLPFPTAVFLPPFYAATSEGLSESRLFSRRPIEVDRGKERT